MVRARLILFDVDGTLVDTDGAGKRALQAAFRRVFGVDDVTASGGAVRFAGMSDLRIVAGLADAAGIAPERLRSQRDRFDRCYLVALEQEMRGDGSRPRVLPGVRELLEELTRRDAVHLGLLTGNLEGGARRKLEPLGLDRFFAGGGFGSDHEDRREIARVAHARLCRRLRIDFAPADVSVVGDTEQDVDCARAHGFRAVAVASGWSSREALAAALPDALLEDLADRRQALTALGLE